MSLDNTLFDAIQLLAEESPRRRMHYDLRKKADAPAGIGHENWKDMMSFWGGDFEWLIGIKYA